MGAGDGELGSGDSTQLSVNKCMDSKAWSTSLNRKGTVTRAVTHVGLEDNVLSERDQTRKDKRSQEVSGGVRIRDREWEGVGTRRLVGTSVGSGRWKVLGMTVVMAAQCESA